MQNKVSKYAIGDIIKLNSYESVKKIITDICYTFYDETGCSKEIYYYIKLLDSTFVASPIKESSIDKYYTKILNE